MVFAETVEQRDPPLNTVEVVLREGHLDSLRDVEINGQVLQRVALRLTEDAIRKTGWEGARVLRGRVGPFYVRAYFSRPQRAVVVSWYDSPAGRRLAREVLPLLSEPEFFEGSLIGRARLVGVFLAGAILTPISEEAVQKSKLGHDMADLGTRLINAVDDVAENAARKALADLSLDGQVGRHGTTLSVTLSLPPGRVQLQPPDGLAQPSKKRRKKKQTGRR